LVNGRELRVLVLEDDPAIGNAYRGVLTAAGHSVALAENGAEGLELLPWRPDVIVLDLGMPVMDGQEFLRRMEAPHAPVLVASATMPPESLRGVSAVILKPFALSQLVLRVRALAGPHRGGYVDWQADLAGPGRWREAGSAATLPGAA
jgi:CheY-like chemotaxis protein